MDQMITVRSVLEQRITALVAGDTTAMHRLLHEDFVYTNAAGEVLGREAYLDRYLRDPAVRWSRQHVDELAIQVHGELAVATCRVHDHAWFGERELDAVFRTTWTLLRQPGGWRFLAGHTGPAGMEP